MVYKRFIGIPQCQLPSLFLSNVNSNSYCETRSRPDPLLYVTECKTQRRLGNSAPIMLFGSNEVPSHKKRSSVQHP